MRAIDEIKRLQAKIDSGEMSPDEPLFVLRSQDLTAARTVREWAFFAELKGTPDEKIREANALADRMDEWPIKQIPGRPETRTVKADCS
jgi:hypothetical protein